MRLFFDYWDSHIVAIRAEHGFVLRECVVPIHGCRDDGDAAFDRGAFGWVGDKGVGDCEGESGTRRATDREKLVGVTADGRGILVGPFTHLYAVQELGWCFVLWSQTIVHADND